MEKGIREYSGRQFCAEDMALIKATTQMYPKLSQKETKFIEVGATLNTKQLVLPELPPPGLEHHLFYELLVEDWVC